jgi:hypothetical protein
MRGEPSGPSIVPAGRSSSERVIQTSSGKVSGKEVVTTDGPAPVSARVVLTVSAESTR